MTIEDSPLKSIEKFRPCFFGCCCCCTSWALYFIYMWSMMLLTVRLMFFEWDLKQRVKKRLFIRMLFNLLWTWCVILCFINVSGVWRNKLMKKGIRIKMLMMSFIADYEFHEISKRKITRRTDKVFNRVKFFLFMLFTFYVFAMLFHTLTYMILW